MTGSQNLHIVIPVFNGWPQTRQCLERLRQSTSKEFSVLVVDHGSTDGTRDHLERDYPEVIRIPGSPDLWWTGATNLGIRTALEHGADAVMLLNNDCYLEPGAIKALLDHGSHEPETVIAPVQRAYPDGAILTTALRSCFLLGFPLLHTSRRSLYNPARHELIPVHMIAGGRGAIIPASVLARVGLLDEARLPHYGSDVDFYLRCRREGIPLFIACDTLVDVDEATTTLSRRLGSMKLAQFAETLRNRRSHRNLRDLSTLFRLHYPIPGLWWIGVGLNLLRYAAVYVAARVARLFAPAGRK